MATNPAVADHLNKLREERVAREKARIEKLRELNLKKYSKDDVHKSAPNVQALNRTNSTTSMSVKNISNHKQASNPVKNSHVNRMSRLPTSAPANTTSNCKIPVTNGLKQVKTDVKPVKSDPKPDVKPFKKPVDIKPFKKPDTTKFNDTNKYKATLTRIAEKTESNTNHVKEQNFKPAGVNATKIPAKNDPKNARKSLAVQSKMSNPKPTNTRKTMLPTMTKDHESVFDRLYKPKFLAKKPVDDIHKLHTDPEYLKKVIHNSGLLLNKRHTVFESRIKEQLPVRRSISAVHFKRISKNEASNCIHKWSSIGDKLDTEHLNVEDHGIKEDKVISAVKSERKKVKFLTPVPNFNTPRPDELQARLKSWLQKRGKNLQAYKHLQCFGINHLSKDRLTAPKFELYDEENKENIALDSDSDDGSYIENMNDRNVSSSGDKVIENDKWRRASCSTVDFNDSRDTTMTAGDAPSQDAEELILGALNDLTELLKEKFEWEQCARWLRAIRERFPSATLYGSYWECRAALEERRGDLPASVHCWEEAIAKGTEHSVVEANLDQLLDKFMQLKISPNSGKQRPADPKMVDVKNVFKSTIIRFAVQQAKLRQSLQPPTPKYTVTPVRRSARLTSHWSGRRTPLQVCTSIRQADELVGEKLVFVPNDQLRGTP